MKKIKKIFAFFLLIFITGCNSVYTTHPIGDGQLKISPEKWNGTWINKDGCVVVKVTDSEKGKLIVAIIEDEKDNLKLKKYDVEIRGTNDFVFINIKTKNEKGKILYIWGKIIKKEKEIVVFGPIVDKFRNLVETGKLPGKIKNKDVYLNPLKEDHKKFIMSEKNSLLFDLNNPFIFFRLKR